VRSPSLWTIWSKLRECSLILSGTEMEGGVYRFRMLETLREYGQERLAENREVDALRDRHLTYFLALAEGAEPHLKSAEQVEWLNRLETEHDNLREAIHFSNEQRRISSEEAGSEPTASGEAGLKITLAVWRFLGRARPVEGGTTDIGKRPGASETRRQPGGAGTGAQYGRDTGHEAGRRSGRAAVMRGEPAAISGVERSTGNRRHAQQSGNDR